MRKPGVVYYMVLDVTSREQLKLRWIAPMREATLLGQIYMAEHPDRKVIAPPIEGRSFGKFELQDLQYLFWNTFNETPFDDYAILVQQLTERFNAIEPFEAEIAALEAQLEAARPDTDAAPRRSRTSSGEPKAPKEKKEKAPSDGKPKATSTCGLVWQICDKHLAASDGEITKELRAAVIAECDAEGINKSTASVQFGKWKSSKLTA